MLFLYDVTVEQGLRKQTARGKEQDALWECLVIIQAVKLKIVVSLCAALDASIHLIHSGDRVFKVL